MFCSFIEGTPKVAFAGPLKYGGHLLEHGVIGCLNLLVVSASLSVLTEDFSVGPPDSSDVIG